MGGILVLRNKYGGTFSIDYLVVRPEFRPISIDFSPNARAYSYQLNETQQNRVLT